MVSRSNPAVEITRADTMLGVTANTDGAGLKAANTTMFNSMHDQSNI